MEKRTIAPGKRAPYVWNDLTQPVKKLCLFFEGREKKLVIDKMFNKPFNTSQDTVR
jgi:hypothetical protein